MKVNRDRMLIIGLVVVAVIVLIWNFANPPQSNSKGAGKLLPVAQAESEQKSVMAKLTHIRDDSEKMMPRIQEASYAIPSEQLEPKVIRQLQTIAKQAQVHLREIRPLRPKLVAGGQGAKVPIEVRFQSTFNPNVIRFLYLLEDPAGKIVVDKMNLTTADPRQKSVDVTVSISVYTRSAAGVAGTETGEIQK